MNSQRVTCVFKFQTPLNEALRYGFRNIVELLLKKGASLNMSEKSEDGTEVFPMDIAQKDVALLGREGNSRILGFCNFYVDLAVSTTLGRK